MAGEIKRTRWRAFLRQLNSDNIYRTTNITQDSANAKKPNGITRGVTIDQFMGITLRKKNGRIEALEIAQAAPDPEKVARPVVTIGHPARITVKKTKHGTITHVLIFDKQGNQTQVKFSGNKDEARASQLVEQLAYAIFERRGFEPGHHDDDWLEAEEKIRQVEAEIVK